MHNLQDLIRIVQTLGLQKYNGLDLRRPQLVGEGGCYRVSRCYYQDTKVIAVKQVKLPSVLSEQDQFHRRVQCVKKDLEVMHYKPLTEHTNIVRILGYGWGLSTDSALPFLVTEYAEYGNLRHYISRKASSLSLVSRMKLTGHVASGLHALHLCGIAHGDVKLENVLVFKDASKDAFDLESVIPKLVSIFFLAVSRANWSSVRRFLAPWCRAGRYIFAFSVVCLVPIATCTHIHIRQLTCSAVV